MMKRRFNDDDIKRIVEHLKQGATVWQTTEWFYDFRFDHSDKKTWIFYQKINNIRRKFGLTPIKLNLSIEAQKAIDGFVKKHGEAKLVRLIQTNQ